jgi:hypothetical protein
VSRSDVAALLLWSQSTCGCASTSQSTCVCASTSRAHARAQNRSHRPIHPPLHTRTHTHTQTHSLTHSLTHSHTLTHTDATHSPHTDERDYYDWCNQPAVDGDKATTGDWGVRINAWWSVLAGGFGFACASQSAARLLACAQDDDCLSLLIACGILCCRS